MNMYNTNKCNLSKDDEEAKILLHIEILENHLELIRAQGKFQPELIQHWIQRIFEYLFRNNILSAEEISLLHDKGYSKATFGIYHPMLVDNINETEDGSGNDRYWQKEIGGYYICSQWNVNIHDQYECNIKWWFRKVLPDYISRGLNRRY